jgi:hypothetical protein
MPVSKSCQTVRKREIYDRSVRDGVEKLFSARHAHK